MQEQCIPDKPADGKSSENDEHWLRHTEEQLLRDGKLWLRRAAELYTHTSKIKIWVPVAGSLIMTCYYLYTIHKNAAAAPDPPPPAVIAESSPTAVPEAAPLPKAPDFKVQSKPASFTATVASSAVLKLPDDDASLRDRAEEAHTSQQYLEEAKLLQQLAKRTGNRQVACPALGRAYERAGDLESAARSFQSCLASEPGNVEMEVSLAHVLQSKHDFKQASALYQKVLSKDSGNMDAQTGLAQVELNQNHLPEADRAVRAILSKAPSNTDALLIAGIVAWRQTRLADAEKMFLKGQDLDDRRADFHAFLGRIAEAEKRPQEALKQYGRALALDPHDLDISDRRDRLKDKSN